MSGGIYESCSQSNELRNVKQVYRQKSELKPKVTQDESDELIALIRYQREHNSFLGPVDCIDSYYSFISTDIQINGIAQFCCADGNVLSVDTNFNLYKNWLKGKHPIYLAPCLLHFRKDEFTFNRLFKEMYSFDQRVQKLKVIGTDQDMAIYNGFEVENAELKLLLCVFQIATN